MPSVSNIAIGAALAGTAADKARHGMNESIARLSTGVRAMYGGDAAGHSVGTTLTAKSKSFSAAVRNIEDGISMLQQSEALLLEVANLATRGMELGIQENGMTSALGTSAQIAALDDEVMVLTDTIDSLLTNTKFNGKTLETANIAVGINDAGTTHSTGANKDITATDDGDATGFDTQAATALNEIAVGLGHIAADLASLKAFQAVAANTSANLAAAAARIMDTDFAKETSSLTKNTILNQAAQSMVAQANQAQSAILAVLQ